MGPVYQNYVMAVFCNCYIVHEREKYVSRAFEYKSISITLAQPSRMRFYVLVPWPGFSNLILRIDSAGRRIYCIRRETWSPVQWDLGHSLWRQFYWRSSCCSLLDAAVSKVIMGTNAEKLVQKQTDSIILDINNSLGNEWIFWWQRTKAVNLEMIILWEMTDLYIALVLFATFLKIFAHWSFVTIIIVFGQFRLCFYCKSLEVYVFEGTTISE